MNVYKRMGNTTSLFADNKGIDFPVFLQIVN